jgi:hypothetical protein
MVAPAEVDTSGSTTNKALARRVLEEIFPNNDVDALREVVSDHFVRITALLDDLNVYCSTSEQRLSRLGLAPSNRDPLAEFAEQFVAARGNGQFAEFRVNSLQPEKSSCGANDRHDSLARAGFPCGKSSS